MVSGTSVTPLGVDEITALLSYEFDPVKDVLRVRYAMSIAAVEDDAVREGLAAQYVSLFGADYGDYVANRKPEEPDDDSCGENDYISEQMDARAVAPLKEYYLTPSTENLLAIKSRIGRGIDPEFSPPAIEYLLEKLDKPVRTEREEDAYNVVIQQQRILATPDDVWRQALEENAGMYECFTNVPFVDGDEYDGRACLEYYRTLVFEGGAEEILKELQGELSEYVELAANNLIQLGIYEEISTTIGLGVALSSRNHLFEKGLDGYIDVRFPLVYYIIGEGKNIPDAYSMRFFFDKPSEYAHYPEHSDPGKQVQQLFSEVTNGLMGGGLKVVVIDENIESVPYVGFSGLRDVLSR